MAEEVMCLLEEAINVESINTGREGLLSNKDYITDLWTNVREIVDGIVSVYGDYDG